MRSNTENKFRELNRASKNKSCFMNSEELWSIILARAKSNPDSTIHAMSTTKFAVIEENPKTGDFMLEKIRLATKCCSFTSTLISCFSS